MTRKNHDRIISLTFTTLLLCFFLSPLHAIENNQKSRITRFEQVEEAIVRIYERILAEPENPDLYCVLAEFLLMKGQYEKAEESLKKALKTEPQHIKSLIVLSNLYRRKIEYKKGLELLQNLISLFPTSIEVKLLEAQYAIDRMDFKKAGAIYQSLLQDNPQFPEAVYGIAEVFYWEDKFEQAEEYIAKCLSLDPEFSPAYQLQSKIHRLRQENNEWRELGRKAVELYPFDDDAQANLAIILMRGEGKMKEGHKHYRIALKINPYSIESHLYLGTGWKSTDYKDQKLEGDEETVHRIQELLKKGDEHLLKLELAEASEAFSRVLELMPTNIKALIGKGTLHYHKKDYDAALDWFFKVLDIDPDYGLAHYGISRSLLRKKDRFNIRFAEIERKFASKDVPEPPYLREVFINYDRLDPDLQKIIRFSVQPLKHYLKTLSTAGATFYLIPFHKLLWESPYLAGMKGTRTFDLRLWDDVKGCGGFNSTSGEDWEKDVKYLRYNVVAHEFTHQVHGYLTEEQRKEIKHLFTKAKKERITLDFYADFNEWEYFAVGVEAYVSEAKLADQKLGYGHIRKELLDKDPDLYNLIESLGKLESYQENEILAFIRKTSSAYRRVGKEKTLKALEDALEKFGNHPAILDAMADTYIMAKEYDKAKEMHERMIREFPDDSSGPIGLANDYLFFERNTAKAIEILESQIKAHPDFVELLSNLGQLYYLAGDLDRMESVFKKALSIDPYADPYSGSNPYFYLSQGLIDKEKYQEAEKLLQYTLDEIDKNNPQVYAGLAFIALQTGELDKGQEYLEQAVKLGRRLPLVQEIQALYLVSQGKQDEAHAILEKLAKRFPGRIETKIHLARMVMESDPEKARTLLDEGLETAISDDPLDMRMAFFVGIPGLILSSRLHSAYGDLLEKEGNTEGAIVHYQKAWDLFQYNYASAVSLVKLYQENGKKKKAKKAFQELKTLDPPNSYIEECEKILQSRKKKKRPAVSILVMEPDFICL